VFSHPRHNSCFRQLGEDFARRTGQFLEGGTKMRTQQQAPRDLSRADIEQLLQPETARDERRSLVRRLVAQAARNPRPTADFAGEAQTADYDAALHKAFEATRKRQERLRQERRDAGRLWDLLESQSPARRRIRVGNDRRFQTCGFYECLLERSQSLLDRSPQEALEAAELALAAARGLSAEAYGEASVRDFQGAALVALATARRVAGDLAGAGKALDQAAATLTRGSGDPLETAELESARAALLRDLGQPEEAERAGRKALRLAHRAGGPKRPFPPREVEEAEPQRGERRVSISGFRPRRH
jgi:tetratricopeptide (TPR) repeat protein